LPSEEEVVKPADAGEKPVAVPAASDPKAKEYVEKAVKAFTAGKPELVGKGNTSRAVLKGRVIRQDVGTTDTERTITAVWPDRIAVTDDVQGRRVTAYSHRPNFAVVQQGREVEELPNRAETARNFTADVTAQHWMCVLAPLLDKKAVVFDARPADVVSPQTGQPQAVNLLKLALPDSPLYQLVFDGKTDLLLRVEYTLVEQGVRRRKRWSALEHKPGPDGQMLPSKLEMGHDGTIVEQWAETKWEFPATIPDTEFSPPKQ
jgi:hypothetical protein